MGAEEELLVGQWLVAIDYLLESSFHGVMQGVHIMFQSLRSRVSAREKMVTEKISYIFKSLMVNEE